MIALTKIKQAISVLVVQNGITKEVLATPGAPVFTEVVLPSVARLEHLGILTTLEVPDASANKLMNKNTVEDTPVDTESEEITEVKSANPSGVEVTIKTRKRRKQGGTE